MKRKNKKFLPYEKNINSIKSNIHKSYFKTDQNGIITGYKNKVCIDRAELKAKLNPTDYQTLLSECMALYGQPVERIERLPNGFMRHMLVFDLTSVNNTYIEFIPHEKPNIHIQLQSKFTTNYVNNDPFILDMLNFYPVYITRLDIAFDYNTPYAKSAYLRKHGNQKQKNYDESISYGSAKNKNKKHLEAHYNQSNIKQMGFNSFKNRFEAKLYFNANDNVTFHNFYYLHSIIIDRLKKEYFIPHLDFSPFTGTVKTRVGTMKYTDLISHSKTKDNDNYIQFMLGNKSKWTTFRKNFIQCGEDFQLIYSESSSNIFDFLLSDRFKNDAM